MREDVFKSDAIWTTFAQIETALDAFSDSGKANSEFSDLKKQINYVRWVLERSDSSLITQQEMNQTRSELGQILAHLPGDAASWQYLGAIQGQLSQTLMRFSQIRQKRLVRSESMNLLSFIEGEIEKLKLKLDEISSSLVQRVGAVSDAVGIEQSRLKSLQEELAKIEAVIATRFDSWEAKLDADYQTKLAGWTAELTAFQLNVTEQTKATLKTFSDDIEKEKSKILTAAQALITDRESANNSLLALYSKMSTDGNSTLKSLVEIYEQAGQIALSGGFVEASGKEELAYRSNANWAKVFFVLSTIVLGFIWYDSVENKLSGLTDVILRLPVSVVFLLPAFYFASLASKHRKTAVSLRSLGLRIKAFDAYTIRATEADRQKLREELAPVFFDEERAISGNNTSEEAFIGKVVDRVGSVVEKVMDKLPLGKG